MELTFGEAQVYTSEKMKNNVHLAKLFQKVFGYTNVGNYARFTIFKKVVEALPLRKNSKVLDLGTGYGEYAISMANALPLGHIHALDIDQERINSVEEAITSYGLENVTTHCSTIEEMKDDEFDFIFSIDVFEHIAPEEMPFKTAFDKLKTGGYFMVKIPTDVQKTIFPEKYFEDHNHWLEDEHIGQVYDLEGLTKRFENEGFKVVYASNTDGWLSRLAWEINYLAKKLSMVTHVLSLPIAKLLIKADRLIHRRKWGNAIQVVGKKK